MRLVLTVGVHHGPAIAMTANGILDYFGRTVNLAARVAGQSLGGDVVVLRDVLAQASPAASRRPATPGARPAAEPAAPPRRPGPPPASGPPPSR